MVTEEARLYTRIRVKRSDHAKIVERITHTRKIENIITDAMVALEEKEHKKRIRK